jgi:hypothetical protein
MEISYIMPTTTAKSFKKLIFYVLLPTPENAYAHQSAQIELDTLSTQQMSLSNYLLLPDVSLEQSNFDNLNRSKSSDIS